MVGMAAYTFLDKKPAINDCYKISNEIILYKDFAA
ncbi:hypothetical protein Rain11_0394 [Raineya orbicola]|uniref:Uncharacterized protein n=1 Tax=Raineya orbicola TaxID=2016530 RepID=A0A2N3IK33_9BACT|nr:hypothetical protein Rain11_0394 [Raineya orbicola]